MTKKRDCPCLVCGVTGRTSAHFGSVCCMACASFFRRTVSFGIRFLCKANNSCVISEDVRLFCRSCRYDGCIRAGMKRELVQQKRDDSRVPKYVLESRKEGIREVVRGYTTSNNASRLEGSTAGSASPVSSRADSPSDPSEFSTILNVPHDELLQYYVKQVHDAASQRPSQLPEDPYEQFIISKSTNDRLALDICTSCPGTDLLEKADLEVLFRYCSFASLWMDSAWISARNSENMRRVDSDPNLHGDTEQKENETGKNVLVGFINHFQSTVGAELSRIQLDVVEYAALKSFCIWKLSLLDSTLTLRTVAQEQYFGITSALSKYYQNTKSMEPFEMATRLADITLFIGSVFNAYQDTLKMYETLGIRCSIDEIGL